MVIRTEFLVLTCFVETDFGVVTLRISGGLNLVVKMKNDNNKKDTSHIAVISIFVLFRGTLTFGIFAYFLIRNIRSNARAYSISSRHKIPLFIYTRKQNFESK